MALFNVESFDEVDPLEKELKDCSDEIGGETDLARLKALGPKKHLVVINNFLYAILISSNEESVRKD